MTASGVAESVYLWRGIANLCLTRDGRDAEGGGVTGDRAIYGSFA